MHPKILPCSSRLQAPRGLTGELVARLTADIVSGKLPPGSQLPTEQEMIAATGVSRTVMREAVAALRADRLVVTRQGVGAFVADHVRRPFRVDFDENSPLRESCSMSWSCAPASKSRPRDLPPNAPRPPTSRRSPIALPPSAAAIDRGDNAVDQDFAFHCEIADATGNPQFKRFLEYLGRFIIPRRTVWGSSAPPTNRTHLEICSSASTRRSSHAIRDRTR